MTDTVEPITLPDLLLKSTEAMANVCAVAMPIWNEHSNNCIAAASALRASEERIKKLEEALGEIAKNDGWIGVPTETEAAVHLGLSLQEVVFHARQALEE